MEKNIAFFDFDGTITTKDSFLDFIKYNVGKVRYYLGLFLLSPYYLYMKLGFISRHKLKEKFITYFLKGTNVIEFERVCNEYVDNRLPVILNRNSVLLMQNHLTDGDEVCVVSASFSNWLLPWTKTMNVNCICSELEILNHEITGKIKGENCNFEVKSMRINEKYLLKNYHNIYGYGDSEGDLEMLKLCTESYYKKFPKLIQS